MGASGMAAVVIAVQRCSLLACFLPAAYLLPGTYYKNSNPELDGTFDKSVLGLQLLGTASF